MNNYIKKTKSILLASVVFIVASLAVLSAQYVFNLESVEAQDQPLVAPAAVSTPTTPAVPSTILTGYAWSENIGWISFRDGSVPVEVGSDGTLKGYAWSENIGWIQFGGLSTTDMPTTTFETKSQAKLINQTLTGWARAVAGISGSNRGGWDGWIALNGVKIELKSSELAKRAPLFASGCSATGCKNGAAWGSDVVGWIDFSGVTTMEERKSCDTSIPGIKIRGDASSFTFYTEPDADSKCTSKTYTCTDGVLNPVLESTYSQDSCPAPKECTRAGKTYNDGDKVTFYAKPIAGAGETCIGIKTELTCTNGEFYKESTPPRNPVLDDGAINKNVRCINNPGYIEQ